MFRTHNAGLILAMIAFLMALTFSPFALALFADGTKILTEQGRVPIEKIDAPNSRLIAFSKEWLPVSFQIGRSFAPGHENHMLRIEWAAGEHMVVTPDQTFMLPTGQMIAAENIKPHETLLRAHDGHSVKVTEKKAVPYDGYLRTLRIQAKPSHLIDANGLIAGDDTVFEADSKPFTGKIKVNRAAARPWTGEPFSSALAGSPKASLRQHEPQLKPSELEFIEMAWDGDKICKIRWKVAGANENSLGDAKTCSNFRHLQSPGKLQQVTLFESRWGQRSLRRIEIIFDNGKTFAAGPAGFDREVRIEAPDGFYINDLRIIESAEGHIQAMGLQVSRAKPLKGTKK